MASFQGKRVSSDWEVILNEYVRQGGKLQLNSGQRTMDEQAALWRQNMIDRNTPKPGRPFTAWPSPTAPHIKEGHQNHALDVDSVGDGENKLQRWLARNDVNAVNNVSGESWHLDPVDEKSLGIFADKIRKENRERELYPTVRKGAHGQRRHVHRLQRYLRAVGYKSVTANGKFDRRTQWAVMRFKRKHRLDGGRKVVGKPMWKALERVMERSSR